jgi:hypothetical protein
MKRLHAQILERALVLSGVPVYDGRVKADDIHKLLKVEASDEVEVDFQHEGKNWVAVFDVLDAGSKGGGREPETYEEPTAADVQLAGFHLKSDPSADVDPPNLSDEKLEQLADQASQKVADREPEDSE